jgi:S1-C subfamily serine protease
MKSLEKVLKQLKYSAVFQWCRSKLQLAVTAVAVCCFLGCVVLLAAKAPEIHKSWIRSKVGSKVFTIKGARGQGTGFAVRAPSGISYIMTNDHVCNISTDGTLLVIGSDGQELVRKIVQRSGFSDLCILEGMPGVEGLEIGSDAKVGQQIISIGHPAGYALTQSRGEVIQKQDVEIPTGPISQDNGDGAGPIAVEPERGGIPADKCMSPKHKQVDQLVQIFIFSVKVRWCVTVTKDAYFTNMPIQAGSSGSPLVDFFGNVIGVVFAADQAQWGVAVNNKDLKDFLKPY